LARTSALASDRETEEIKESVLSKNSYEDQTVDDLFKHLSHLSQVNRETQKYQQVDFETAEGYDIKFYDPKEILKKTPVA